MIPQPPSSDRNVVWNPSDYARNSASQLAWARELMARLYLRGDERILDVGCGDGKATADLAQAVPHGAVVGIDNSPEMIRYAAEIFSGRRFANLEFQVMDARRIHFLQPFDLIVSNSALHWVDDHPAFLQGAAGCLRVGGRLVVSSGGRGNAQDVFMALRGTIRGKRWRAWFRKLETAYFFHSPAEYNYWLPRCGLTPTLINLTPKDTVHASPADFAAWFRTTWMPYTQRLPDGLREEFVTELVARYLMNHPANPNGGVRVQMMRLEIDAVKTVRGNCDRRELKVWDAAELQFGAPIK